MGTRVAPSYTNLFMGCFESVYGVFQFNENLIFGSCAGLHLRAGFINDHIGDMYLPYRDVSYNMRPVTCYMLFCDMQIIVAYCLLPEELPNREVNASEWRVNYGRMDIIPMELHFLYL